MNNTRRIYITGVMGSGKTSVNKDKNIHKKHICNQQKINLL